MNRSSLKTLQAGGEIDMFTVTRIQVEILSKIRKINEKKYGYSSLLPAGGSGTRDTEAGEEGGSKTKVMSSST